MSDPLPGYLKPLTIPLSGLYYLAVAVRNARFDKGKGVTKLSLPVISVGNITTGGTGKTPMVMWITRLLVANGHKPVIAMRGYGATEDQQSDEHVLYEEYLADVPVLADADRIKVINSYLPTHPEISCVLLDDGFQHRFIARDLDLVLIDDTQNSFSQRLLPAGHLREPLANLKRADAVIVTRADPEIEDNVAEIELYHGKKPVAWSQHKWTGLDIYDPDLNSKDVNWLNGKGILTMLGVGNPKSICQQIEAFGAKVAVNVPVSDHQKYSNANIKKAKELCISLDAMLVTAKDWVKLRGLIDCRDWPVPVVVPQLDIEFFKGEEQLQELILNAARIK
ncbi:MAG: tetraacyldisaccharide 4'-kinase [Planctomycetes bacterium]|nr:tetraacyldisaccharide 4'-kinase [Planctomycetota bacterium]